MPAGKAQPRGNVILELNPPKPKATGEVKYESTRVRAELDGDQLRVRVSGHASYLDRSVSKTIDLEEDDLDPLKELLEQIRDAYEETVRVQTLNAGAEAYAYAVTHDFQEEE